MHLLKVCWTSFLITIPFTEDAVLETENIIEQFTVLCIFESAVKITHIIHLVSNIQSLQSVLNSYKSPFLLHSLTSVFLLVIKDSLCIQYLHSPLCSLIILFSYSVNPHTIIVFPNFSPSFKLSLNRYCSNYISFFRSIRTSHSRNICMSIPVQSGQAIYAC